MESTTEYFVNDDLEVNRSIYINDTVDISSAGTKANFLLYDYLIPSIGTLIILANLAVVISSGLILKKGQQPRSTYLFLGNVAMTDLITGIAVVFGQVYPKNRRDHYLCAFQLGMIVSSTLTSVYSVGLIAVDRFLYILHGLKYQTWVYPTRARLMICLSWTIGLIIGFLPMMGWHGDTDNGRICWFILLAPKELIMLTVLLGAIPLILVIFLYSIILYHAIKKITQLRTTDNAIEGDPPSGDLRMFRGRSNNAESDTDEQPEDKNIFKRFFKKKPSASVKAPNKWKAIKVVFFTSGSFVLTWCPYFVTSVIYVQFCDFDDTSKRCKTMRLLIASPLAILGFMNSLLNPIIYAWWHKGFRSFINKKVNDIIMKRRDRTPHSGTNGGENSASNATTSTSRNMSTTSSSNRNNIATSGRTFGTG